jgi:hypothetical protein
MTKTTANTPALEVGKKAVVKLLQRVAGTGSLRRAAFKTQWIQEGSRLILEMSWNDRSLRLGFQKEELEAWPMGEDVPERSHGRIQTATAWLINLGRNWPEREASSRAPLVP